VHGVVVHHALSCYAISGCSVPEEEPPHSRRFLVRSEDN
jgi:hypothetical protein